jgi:uncharacterized RDD family membrane protein YckC
VAESAYEKWLEERGRSAGSSDRVVSYRGPRSGQGLAERGTRLVAQLIDGAAYLVAILPGGVCWIVGNVMVAGAADQTSPPPGGLVLLLVGLALFLFGALIFAVDQIVLLARRGQTIGKRAMGIKIVRFGDGSEAGLVHAWVLRSLVPGVIAGLPCIGPVFALADILFIFREDRRCIHDLIADTKVIEV